MYIYVPMFNNYILLELGYDRTCRIQQTFLPFTELVSVFSPVIFVNYEHNHSKQYHYNTVILKHNHSGMSVSCYSVCEVVNIMASIQIWLKQVSLNAI